MDKAERVAEWALNWIETNQGRAGMIEGPACTQNHKTKRQREKEMTRGKQKIEAQKKNAEKNSSKKGSQFEARAVALKITCPICKTQIANHKQLVDHYGSKHPKETPPAESS